jgi:parvulin-like peptidyl-prolyl isomerase
MPLTSPDLQRSRALTPHRARALARLTFIACAALLAVAALCAPRAAPLSPGLARAETIDRIAAIVNDEVITFNDFRREVALHLLVEAEARQQPPMPVGQIDDSPQREALIRKYIEDIVNLRLFAHRAVELKSDITDDMVNATIAQNGTDQQVAASLAPYGIALDDFKRFMKRRLQAEFVSRAEVERQANVKQSDVEVCARKAVPDGERTVRLTIREIRVRMPEYQADLAARSPINQALYQPFFLALDRTRYSFASIIHVAIVYEGAPFEEMARAYSSASNRHRDGLVDQPFLRGDYSAEYAAVYAPVFSLQPGEVSDPIRASFGFHIIRVEDRDEGPNPRWVAKMRECSAELIRAERMKLMEAWFTSQRARQFVQVRLFDELAGP